MIGDMEGTLLYLGGSISAHTDDLPLLIAANERGLVICNTQRDVNELSRACPSLKCHFVSRHEADQKVFGAEFIWAFIPIGFVPNVDAAIRIKWRVRLPGFVNPFLRAMT